ncbi:hypothetical protein L9F63_015465 [Diploptera punctata]|uniref:Ionotropic glutamate receptor C-terminal domain-containing protein n=1 Tax=Diploptera punctata TaxID=6984 RepID=A0AAD8EKH2_DIPPU|nr:hypothetical protein L9F63_015465 [Diploptera punctata]
MRKYFNILDTVVLIYPVYMSTSINSLHVSNETIELYTWFPFSSNNCGRFKQIELINIWSLSSNKFLYNTTIYPNKIPENFRNCQIRVATAEVPMQVKLLNRYVDNNNKTVYDLTGLEILSLSYIQDVLNLSVIYLLNEENDNFQSHFEMIFDVALGNADVAVSFFPLHSSVINIVEPTISYESDYIRWYVPCGRSVSRMDKIINIFTLSVWSAMLVIATSVLIALYCLGNSDYKESRSYQTYISILYNLISVVFGVSLRHLPRSSKVRIIFSLWLWYCFIVSTIFQVFFTSILIDPGNQKPITSLNELLKSKLKYAYSDGWGKYINATSPEYDSKINLDRIPCENFDCIELVINSTNFLTIYGSSTLQYFISTFGHDSDLYICAMPENIFRIDIVMYLRKGSPFLTSFNSAIYQLLEYGFVIKYQNDMKYLLRNKKNSNRSKIIEAGIKYFVFGIKHLIFSFYILLIGHVLSGVIFITELLHHYILH